MVGEVVGARAPRWAGHQSPAPKYKVFRRHMFAPVFADAAFDLPGGSIPGRWVRAPGTGSGSRHGLGASLGH
eukprot:scaffold61596_cov27-Phaeocystis_antarctica.AAC.1